MSVVNDIITRLQAGRIWWRVPLNTIKTLREAYSSLTPVIPLKCYICLTSVFDHSSHYPHNASTQAFETR